MLVNFTSNLHGFTSEHIFAPGTLICHQTRSFRGLRLERASRLQYAFATVMNPPSFTAQFRDKILLGYCEPGPLQRIRSLLLDNLHLVDGDIEEIIATTIRPYLP